MKLHLPKPLRNSVLACIAAVAGIATPTLGTATFAGGVVAFTLASQQAQASLTGPEGVTYTSATWDANGITVTTDMLGAGKGLMIEMPGDQGAGITLTLPSGQSLTNLKLAAAQTDTQTGLNTALDVDTLWLAQGRFRVNQNGMFANVGEVYVGDSQLWFTGMQGAEEIASNFTIGSASFAEGHDSLDNSAIRIGSAVKITGSLSIAEAAKISFQGGNDLEIAGKLKGSAGLTLSNFQSGDSMLYLSGDVSEYTGTITVTEGTTLKVKQLTGAANLAAADWDGERRVKIYLEQGAEGTGSITLGRNAQLYFSQNASGGNPYVVGSLIAGENSEIICTAENGEHATRKFGSLTVNGHTTIKNSSWSTIWEVEELNGEGTLSVNYLSTDLAASMLKVSGSGNYSGEIIVDRTQGSDYWSGTHANLSILSEEAIAGAVVNLNAGSGIKRSAALHLGVESATIGGLKGNTNSFVYYADEVTIQNQAFKDGATLTINAAGSYEYGGVIKQGVDIVMSGSGTQYLAQLAEDTGRIVTATSGTLVLGQIGSAAKLEAKDGATIVLDGGVQVDTNDSYRWGQDQVYYRAHYEGTDTSNTELVGNVVVKGSDTAVVNAQGNATGADGVVTWFDASTFSGHTIEVVSGLLTVYDPTKNGAATDFGTVQTIVLDGGGLVATSPWHYGETDPQITIDTDIDVRGTGYVRCMGTADSTYITTLSGAMTGSGTLVKTDGGTLVLAGDMSDYKGTLKVEKGRLKYAGTGFKGAVNQANDTVLEFAEDATITAATWQNAHLSVSNGAHVSMEVGNELLFNGNSPTFEFSDDGVLAYDGRMRLTNSTLTLRGEGTYELDALVLSANGNGVGNVEIGAGSTLHITGTSMNVSADAGSFLLSNWPANNTVNIHGTLIMEAGLSNRDGTATVNVKDGGVLQFNGAMEGIDNATQQGVVTINVESGAAVKVGGSTGNSANHSYVVNLADATSVTAMGKGATVAMNLNVAENATAVLSTDYSGMVFNSTLAGAGTYEKTGSGIITLSSVSNLKITEGMVKAASGGLNISGALTMNGGSFYYEGRTSGESTVVDLVTASSYNGNLSLEVSDLAAGKYDLFQGAAGLKVGQVTLDANLGRGKAATLSVTNGLVSITVTGSGEIANLVWDTASGDDTWAYGSTNWKNSGEFYASDNVTFADAGETVKVESDIKAGTINVTGDNYVLSGKGTVSSSSFTLAAGKTFSLNTSGNNLGNITLEDGATLNLGVASRTDIGAVIGGGTLSLQGAANINITAGDFTWNRTVSGDNAKLTLIVSNGANVNVNNDTLNNSAIKADGGTVAFANNVSLSKDITIANGGKMSMTANDTFNWSNTTNQNVHIDGGTLDLAASRQSFNQQVKMTLNNATILGTGQINGQDNLGSMDFFQANTITATGVNLIEASIRLREGGGLTFDVQNGTTTVREIHGYKKTDNALSITKSGAGELLLDGTNRAASLTITNGTVAIDKAATLGAGAVSMTAAEGASTPTLVFRGTETKSMSNAINGAGRIVQAGAGSTTLTGLNAAWTGTVAIQKGTLSTGDTLAIGANRTLEVSSGTTLDSALTLAGGSLVMGSATQAWDAETGMSLGGHALTLDSTNKTQLTLHLAEADKAVGTVLTLFTNTSITLNEEDTLGTYFSGVISELSHALLSVVDGSLVATIVPENKLEWAPDTDSVWEDGGTIGNNTYVSADMYSLLFGAVTGTEIVTVKGEVAAKEVVITPGADSVYEFDSATDADKITSADIVLESGTLALAAGVLGDDVTISMLDGTTLQWGTTAEASSTEDYSGKLTINGNVTLDVNGNDVILASAITGTAADKTISFASTGATADAQNTVSINGNAVLGSAAVNVGENVVLKLNSSADHTYSNAISGVGSVYLTSTGGANGTTLGGTNTYSGETIIGSGVSKIVAANFSANTSQIRFDSADGTLQFVSDANYTMDKVITGEAGTLNLWGDAANTAFTLSADSSDWNGTLAIYNKRTIVDLTGAVGGDIVFAGSGRTSTLKVHSALSNAIYTAEGADNAGKLIIDGGTAETPIEWDATGKTYTGQTELAAGAHVTTVGSLTTGANSKIVLGEGSQLTITGGSWTSGHTVSGTGALVIANRISTVNGTDKLVTAGQTLSSLVLTGNGTAFEFRSSGQKDKLNTCTSFTVEDGASLIYNVSLTGMTNTIYLNGDGTGEANSAAMVFATFGWEDNSVHTITTDSSVVLGSDSTICVGAHTHGGVTTNNVGVLSGTLTGEGKTLTKTGTGTLRINRIPNVSKIVVEEGTLDANAAGTWTENITVKDGASMLLSGRTITLSDVTIDAGATTTIITGQANDADSTATLAKVSGSGVIELTRDNDGSRTGDYRVGLTGENADFTGTWKVTGRNVVLQAKHADALAGDTVELSYAGTQTAVSEMSELRLATTGTTVNLGKLTGTAGIVTGSGKTLNIANSETTGVEYSGTIGEGVTIQVSEGYQKITGTGKTGSYVLTAAGGELNLAGYAHSADADTGKTTILATAAGKVSNITLGKNMVLTAQLDDVNSPQSGIFPKLDGTLALAGGSLKVHLGNPVAQAAEGASESLTPIYNAAGMTTYNMNGGTLDLTSNEKTLLTFMPETETGKIAANSAIDILVNINSVVDGTKSWKYSDLENKATAAAKAEWEEEIISVLGNKIQTNLSSTGRAQQSWKVGSDSTSKTLSIHVFIEGGAANLEWVAGRQNWDVKNTIAWDSDNPEGADGLFWDDDNVAFNLASGSPETITVTKAADTEGVRIGSMVVTGGVDYTFKGDAITSGVGLGNVHIGTTGTDGVAYTRTVTFENANSWKGNTNINSGAVVAKNAAALSNTTVNLNGGSLTVDGVAMAATEDGVALHATVKMLGGVLNTTAAEGGAVTVKADLSAAGKNMSVNAATGTNLNLTLVGTEDVDGIIGGNVTINGEVDKEGKPVTAGAVNMTNATVVAGGSLTVSAGDVTTGALVLQGAKKVTEGDTSTEIAAGAVTVEGGSLSATSLANAGSVAVDGASMIITGAVENSGSVTVDDASMSITGAVANTGSLTVTNSSLTMGALDNDGTLTIGGTKMKDVQLGETTVSVPESSVVVNGDLDNKNGTITIGSAAVTDNPETGENEAVAATSGSLTVNGDLLSAGGSVILAGAGSSATITGNLELVEVSEDVNDEGETVEVVTNKGNLSVGEGTSMSVSGDLVANQMELGLAGSVTVAGDVSISKLTIAENALLHATGADAVSDEVSVEIGTLTGAGTVKVDNGTLHIGALSGFTGTLAGKGTLSTDNAQFLLETKQDTTTNIVGGSVKVTTGANGSSVGLVTTNEIIIDTMTTDAPSLSMTGVALKGSDAATIDNLTITLTQMGSTTGVDGIIKAVDAADGGIDYHLLSIAGKQSLDLFKLAEDEDVHQYLLQKGYAHSDLLSAATFAAASSTDVYISFWKQSSEESTWNVGETDTEAGLIVLEDGKVLSNDVLDNVQNVVVSGTKSIDLTAAGVNDVVLNKLVGTSTSKLTIAGDGKAGDSVSIGKSSYNGTLVLDGVAASFDLTGTTLVGADKDTTLSGKLTNGTLSVLQGSTAQGAGLELKDSKVQVVIDKDFTKLVEKDLKEKLSAIATLGDVTIEGSSTVAVGTYNSDTGVLTESVGYDKYFDMSTARVEGGKVVADRNTVYYTSKLTDSASTDNGKAGLAMADEVLLIDNPQGDTVTGGLDAVLDQLDAYVATGNKAGADKLGASLAGASTAVLGMAAMGDVDRQLRAIRNRTTTMGVDQSVVNADMPYFNAWINAEGDSREMGEDETLGGYKLNSYGGTVGFDVDIEPTFTAGMALTAMYGDLDTTGADKATGNLDSYYVSAFARYSGSAWTHTFVGTIGMSDISLDRTVGTAQVQGETDSMSFGLMYEVGRVYAMDEDGTTCLQPVFNVTWKHTTVDAYTEKGGDVALKVDEQSLDTITFGLGARLQTVVGESMYNRTSIFECRLLAKADAGDTEGTSKVALGSSATHEVKSNEMGAVGIELGAGLTIPLGDEGSSIFMDASAEIRADYTDVNGTVGYRVNF